MSTHRHRTGSHRSEPRTPPKRPRYHLLHRHEPSGSSELAGIQGFTRKALQIAQAGIYDLRIHHDEILWPLLRYWNLFDLEGLDPQADQARDRLATHLAKTDRLANRFEAKRAATAANEHSATG